MALSAKHIRMLQRTIKGLQDLIANAGKAPTKAAPARSRRTGKELAAFRKTLAAERKGGASVVDLATKYGVSTAYIYMLPTTGTKAKAKAKPNAKSPPTKPTKTAKRKPAKAPAKAEDGAPSLEESSRV